MEVTQAGGLVMQVISSRAAGTPVLSREKAVAKAIEFLEKRGYPAMRESYFIDQGGILTINFAAVQDEVICYPDLVKVSIALDTGRVVGFESEGYLMNHTLRSFPVLSVSGEEAAAWSLPPSPCSPSNSLSSPPAENMRSSVTSSSAAARRGSIFWYT